jgi:hypothetical protein
MNREVRRQLVDAAEVAEAGHQRHK